LDVESGVSKKEQLISRAKRIGRIGTRARAWAQRRLN
jgi:hypothetical protein